MLPNFFLLTKPHPPILLATPRLLQCRIHWNILSPKIKSMKTFTISVITTIIIRSLFSTGPCSKMYFWPRMWIFSFIYIGVYLFMSVFGSFISINSWVVSLSTESKKGGDGGPSTQRPRKKLQTAPFSNHSLRGSYFPTTIVTQTELAVEKPDNCTTV